MAHPAVRGFSPTVLKWLIPVLLGRCTTTRTGRILDLPAKRGYRAKEMFSSHTFAASVARRSTVTKIAHAKFGLRNFALCKCALCKCALSKSDGSEVASRVGNSVGADSSTRFNFDAATPANECRARP